MESTDSGFDGFDQPVTGGQWWRVGGVFENLLNVYFRLSKD